MCQCRGKCANIFKLNALGQDANCSILHTRAQRQPKLPNATLMNTEDPSHPERTDNHAPLGSRAWRAVAWT